MAAAAFDPVKAGGQDVPLVRTMPLAHPVRVPRSSARDLLAQRALGQFGEHLRDIGAGDERVDGDP